MLDLVVRSKNVYAGDRLNELCVGVKDGVIVSMGTEAPEAAKTVDAGTDFVLPGLADSHVHIREPGNSQRETFASGTAAAVNTGVTLVCEHPLASPPPYNMDILKRRHAAAEGELLADVAFMGAAGENNVAQLVDFAKSGEIIAYKTFLHAPIKGREIEFDGLTMCNDGVLYDCMGPLANAGIPWLVHAENNDMIQYNVAKFRAEGKTSAIYHARSRPPISEYETVAKLLLLTEEKNVPIFFCHISTPEACEMVKRAKARGRKIYLETCPHYLLFTEELLEKYGSVAKCSPPLRTARERDALWGYVNDGTVDVIGSDHAPYPPAEKEFDDVFKASAGLPSLEARVPVMFTEVMKGKLSLRTFVSLMATNIARIFDLYPKKGVIAVGADADFTIIDPDKKRTLRIKDWYSVSREAAPFFDGMEVIGDIHTVILRGELMKENGLLHQDKKGYGAIVRPLSGKR